MSQWMIHVKRMSEVEIPVSISHEIARVMEKGKLQWLNHRCSLPSRIDGTCAIPDCNGDSSLAQRIVWVDQLVSAPGRRTGDAGSNPNPGENFSLKLTI